ncbi:hypothetical protein ACI2KS_10550 [Pseudomonas sp. NPDC087358]|uniref:hypothetical protein n=1 Tax=Pseudomonas sp. NPDC087358 TaxID=3364439 RepID=UPI00384C9961
MSRHATAVRFIERALGEYATAPCPDMTAAAVQMAVELSYAQGDISCDEHSGYSERRRRMVARHTAPERRLRA